MNDLSLQRADITYSYIPRADAVLFLLDAGQILKESERVFLNEKLLKASRDKIVFVITKWDMLGRRPSRRRRSPTRASSSAKLVKDPVVFADERRDGARGQRGESGMPELLGHLTRFLAEERGPHPARQRARRGARRRRSCSRRASTPAPARSR